jgi:COMPASS component SWD1
MIKQIYTNRSGREMVVNSNDRSIRHFKVEFADRKIEATLKFIDSVEKTQWLDCTISADGEYVIGGKISLN